MVQDGFGYSVFEYAMTQLFDLEADPWEIENLAKLPDHAGTVEAMRTQLVAQRDAWDDRASPWGATFWSAVPM